MGVEDPFARLYHYHFCHVCPETYESLDHYHPEDELLRVVRAVVPTAWVMQRDGPWLHARPPGVKLPQQGWKIHVSATPPNCDEVLRRAAAVCVQEAVAFKFAVDRRLVALLTSKGWSREASGKFITVYPADDAHFKQVIEALYTPLRDLFGPYILSDRRYRDARVLHYRYGGITGQAVLSVMGEQRQMLRSPGGDLVPDLRLPYWSPPDWVTDPLRAGNAGGQEAAPLLGDGRYRVGKALGFSVTGGVYMATDLHTASTVVIKEARPYTGVDDNGLDATDRLQKEYRLLKRLQGTGITPEPLALFWDWEHLFLVEELIPGMNLAKFVVTSNPLLQDRCTPGDTEAYVRPLYKIWTNVALAVADLHARNLICGDLSMGNIMLTNRETGEVRIVDLEGAWEEGADPSSPWFGTPGYTPPGGVRQREDDLYALGAVMLATLFPANSLLAVEPSIQQRFLEAAGSDLGLAKPVRQLIARCMAGDANQRPKPAQIVGVLRHPSPPAGQRPVQVDLSDAELLAAVNETLDYILAKVDLDRRDRLVPADPLVFLTNPLSVAHGAAGVAYALHRIAGEVPKAITAWILAQPIDAQRYPPGLYIGTSGLAWVLSELGLEDVGLQILRAARSHPLLWDAADVYYGAAGYGLTSLHFYLRTGDGAWLEQAVEVGEWLLRSRVEQAEGCCWPDQAGIILPGYARGSSGIALYLLYLSLATGEDRYLSTGEAALAHDLAQARPLPDGPLSIPRAPVGSRTDVVSHYWLDGSAGVCTALIRFWACTRNPQYLQTLNRLAPDTFGRYAATPGLFRGLAGLGNFLLDAHDFTGDARYIQEAKKVATGVLLFSMKRARGIVFPGEHLLRTSMDFGTGSAGIALFLHRLAHVDQRVGNFNFTLDTLLPAPAFSVH